MPEITKHTVNDILFQTIYEPDKTLADNEYRLKLIREALEVQEAICQVLRNAVTEGTPLPMEVPATIDRALDQDDFAAASEGPVLHPAFALLTRQFMAPQQVRR